MKKLTSSKMQKVLESRIVRREGLRAPVHAGSVHPPSCIDLHQALHFNHESHLHQGAHLHPDQSPVLPHDPKAKASLRVSERTWESRRIKEEMQGIVSPTPLELHKVSPGVQVQVQELVLTLRPPHLPVVWPAGDCDKGPRDRRFRVQRVRRLLGKRGLCQHDPTRRARGPGRAEALRQDSAGRRSGADPRAAPGLSPDKGGVLSSAAPWCS